MVIRVFINYKKLRTMDKEILKNTKPGEKLVEMLEYTQHGETVYQVTVHLCKKGLFGKRFSKFTYPFYFKTKEFAKEFLKYYDEFVIVNTSYWNNQDISCYGLAHRKEINTLFVMIDSVKQKQYSGLTGKYAQLQYDGVWDGLVCESQYGEYATHDMYMFDFKKIYDKINVAINGTKRYIFKMETE